MNLATKKYLDIGEPRNAGRARTRLRRGAIDNKTYGTVAILLSLPGILIVTAILLIYTSSPWKEITPGISVAEFGNKVIVYALDQKHVSFELAAASMPKSLLQWRQETNALVAINGGYFHPDFSPSGALVVNNKRIGKRAFDQNKTGLVVINEGKLAIRNLATSPVEQFETFEYALQSYPLLFFGGAEKITKDSGKVARRTMIGTDANDTVYLFIFHENQISLFEAMKFLKTLPIEFENVLNLDGGPSTGLSASIDDYTQEIPSAFGVPNVVLVKTKNQ